jgi:hypothetical protein|tara:strand:+ start:996 stop:1166 length:171 start_codon:yes stop_codon:yes gene_type:complete
VGKVLLKMKYIKQTADCLYRGIRVNRHDYHVDDVAMFLLAIFVFGTMFISVSSIGF